MESLDALLCACLGVNDQARKHAEDALKSLSVQPQIVPELLVRVQRADDPQIRQLAAVLLRKRISRHWGQIPLEGRRHTQAVLLEQIAREAVHAVRRSVSDVASVVAKLSMPAGEWPELLAFLQQCGSSSSSTEHREVALRLFTALADNIGEHLQPAVPELIGMVGRAWLIIRRRYGWLHYKPVLPLGLMVAGEKEVRAFHDLVSALLQAAAKCLAEGSEDIAVLACQVLVELVESPAPLLQPHLPAVVAFCMEAAMQRALEPETREQALQVLHWLARYKPKQLTKDKALMRNVVAALCTMCCEPTPAEHDEASGLAPCSMAAQALDSLACHCASQHIHPQVLAFAKQGCQSPDPDARQGALRALAVVAEGCAEALRKRVADVLPLVLGGLADSDQRVRGAAAFALGQFSEYLQPEIVEHYEVVLPALFGVVLDADVSVQERACYALDAFCESLDKEILPFMPTLMDKLLGVLRTTHSHSMQDMALSAIASTVAATGAHIAPYAPTLLPVLQHFTSATHADLLPGRCRATECVGLILEGLGSSAAGPEARALLAGSVPGFMQQGLHGFEVAAASAAASELREYGHGMFACIAKALGQEFAPYLQYVVPLAVQSCKLDDGTFDDGEDEEGDVKASGAGPLGDLSDDDEAGAGRSFNVRTGIMDEKCSATHALGCYAESCSLAFAPHLAACLDTVAAMAGYFHEEVRASAYEALGKLVVAAHAAWPPPAAAAAVPGGGQQQQQQLSPEVQHVLGVAVPALLEGLEDDDKHATSMAFQAVTAMLRRVGLAALSSSLQKVSECAAAVLAGKAPCHDEDGDESDGEEEAGGNMDLEEELLSAVADLLPALAAAAGPAAYAPVFEASHLPPLLLRLKPRQPGDLRAVAVGAVAEVAEILLARMSPHLEKLLPLLQRELHSDDAVNRQNAAFCCGILVEGCGPAMAPYYQQLLQALHPLFGKNEEDGTRDNAVGAVARLILAAGAGLPLEQVVPVFLKGLPLKEDLREAPVVYRALARVMTSAETMARMLPLASEVVAAFGDATVQPGVPQEALQEVGHAMLALQHSYSQQLEAVVRTLPEDRQQGLARVMAAAAGTSS